MYVAFDQWGHSYRIKQYPRKELCEYFDRKRASKMYRDGPDDQPIHCGYVISGHWLEVFRLEPMEG